MLSNNILFSGKHIPLRDFFKNPEKTSYRISKDGKYLSYLAPYKNRLNIFVQKIGEETPVRITHETERDITSYFWGNNERILFLKDNKGDENFHLYAVGKDGSNPIDLTPFEYITTQIIDELEEIDSEVLIGLNKRNQEIFDVYRLNIDTGEMKMTAENPGNISAWYTDHDGKIRAAITTDGVNNSLLYRENEQDPFKTVLTTSFKVTVNPLFFTFDNKHVYATSNLGRDKNAIVKFDLAGGKELEVIFEHPKVDVYDLQYSKKRKVPTYIGYNTWKRELKFFDEESELIYRKITGKLGNYEVVIADMNKDEDRFLIRTYSDRSLGCYYFYDNLNDKLIKLADVSPWLNEDELCEMNPIEYESRDGIIINGYLTLPKTDVKKELPVVMFVHGGPWARDSWTYNPEVQFLSNRGYSVLQVNFRGSTGYGRKFWESSFKQWGKTMQNDITDGVKWLIDKGIADPKRIAIYGGSYGGYAVLAGLTFSPELYACGVDYVGVSNLFTFMKTIPPYWKPFLEMMYEMVGDPEKDKELLTEASPVFHVDKIKAPLFIAQGRMDPRVNVNESDQMVSALKKRGIEVPYMVKDNEGHGFRNEENRFEFYEVMEKFLQKHLDGK
ncbi:MAG: S9 family peptidase [Ignavibacteria bacterium]|jgi:dipeptidyl aminopeptidase/acylaminoacyl peptidase